MFDKAKVVGAVGVDPKSKLLLLVITAVNSRPWTRKLFLSLLRRCADASGIIWVTAKCEFSQKPLNCALRLDELASDFLSFHEIVVCNAYRIDAGDGAEVVIDGGANLGFFGMAMLSRLPELNAILVEPLPKNVEMIEAHLSRNAMSAAVIPAALAASTGEANFYVRSANAGGLGVADSFASTMTVPTSRLSEIYALHRDRRVLIKLDIEGSEIAVIEEFLREKPLAAKMVGELHHWREHRQKLIDLFEDAAWNVQFFAEDPVCVLFTATSASWEGRTSI